MLPPWDVSKMCSVLFGVAEFPITGLPCLGSLIFSLYVMNRLRGWECGNILVKGGVEDQYLSSHLSPPAM